MINCMINKAALDFTVVLKCPAVQPLVAGTPSQPDRKNVLLKLYISLLQRKKNPIRDLNQNPIFQRDLRDHLLLVIFTRSREDRITHNTLIKITR